MRKGVEERERERDKLGLKLIIIKKNFFLYATNRTNYKNFCFLILLNTTLVVTLIDFYAF